MSRRKTRNKEKADAPQGGSAAGLWCAGMGAGVLLMLAPGSAILLGAMLAPVVFVLLLPGRHGGARTVQASVLFGLAACVHPLHLLWLGDPGLASAIALLRQPMVLPTVWIALLAGWLVSELATAVLRIHADIVAAGLRRQMMEQITAIEEEWGPMPASAPLPPL